MSKEPARSAYYLLKIVFVVAPIIAGIDKFLYLLVDWSKYLMPAFSGMAQTLIMIVGVVEVLVGIGVIIKPKIFANVVGVWLVLIIINLIILGDFYDIALRDLGLCLSAFALGRLAKVYGR